MPDTKISAMVDAGTLGGTEIIPLVSGGLNKSTTPSAVLTYAKSQANTWLDTQTIQKNGIGTTQTDGLVIQNTTAAAAGAQQRSSRLRFTGQGWKTAATAGSQTVDFTIDLLPVQGSANPSSTLVFSSQINGGGYTSKATLTSDGDFTATGNLGASSGTITATNTWTVNSAQNRVASGVLIGFSSSATNAAVIDAGFGRNAANIVEVNNGTAGQWASLKAGVRDSATNTTSVGLTIGHQSTGTPAASFGIGLLFNLNSDTTADQNAAQIETIWTTATHASRTSNLLFKTVTNAGSLLEVLRLIGTDTSIFGWRMTSAASGGTPNLSVTTPTQASSTTAGTPLSITASNAVAGSSSAGAAIGGDVTITAGNAARLTSGNANGGNINLTPGAGIGTGVNGYVQLCTTTGSTSTLANCVAIGATSTTLFNSASNTLNIGFGGDNSYNIQTQQLRGIVLPGGGAGPRYFAWNGNTASAGTTVHDTALTRNAAAVVEVNNGTAGQWGALKAGMRDSGTNTITDGLTLGHQSTGTPAAGLGSAIQINIDTTTTADVNAVRLTGEWVVATHASRTARYKINVYDTASRECLRCEASGSAPMIGVLGAAAVVQQTSGANLTNNVTSGGTDDTIANYTDLTVYANDAAAIRNNIYQLARKLKQINDGLRLFGFFT